MTLRILTAGLLLARRRSSRAAQPSPAQQPWMSSRLPFDSESLDGRGRELNVWNSGQQPSPGITHSLPLSLPPSGETNPDRINLLPLPLPATTPTPLSPSAYFARTSSITSATTNLRAWGGEGWAGRTSRRVTARGSHPSDTRQEPRNVTSTPCCQPS